MAVVVLIHFCQQPIFYLNFFPTEVFFRAKVAPKSGDWCGRVRHGEVDRMSGKGARQEGFYLEPPNVAMEQKHALARATARHVRGPSHLRKGSLQSFCKL